MRNKSVIDEREEEEGRGIIVLNFCIMAYLKEWTNYSGMFRIIKSVVVFL